MIKIHLVPSLLLFLGGHIAADHLSPSIRHLQSSSSSGLSLSRLVIHRFRLSLEPTPHPLTSNDEVALIGIMDSTTTSFVASKSTLLFPAGTNATLKSILFAGVETNQWLSHSDSRQRRRADESVGNLTVLTFRGGVAYFNGYDTPSSDMLTSWVLTALEQQLPSNLAKTSYHYIQSVTAMSLTLVPTSSPVTPTFDGAEQSTTQQNNNDRNTRIIISTTVVASIAFVVLLAAWWFVRRRKQRRLGHGDGIHVKIDRRELPVSATHSDDSIFTTPSKQQQQQQHASNNIVTSNTRQGPAQNDVDPPSSPQPSEHAVVIEPFNYQKTEHPISVALEPPPPPTNHGVRDDDSFSGSSSSFTVSTNTDFSHVMLSTANDHDQGVILTSESFEQDCPNNSIRKDMLDSTWNYGSGAPPKRITSIQSRHKNPLPAMSFTDTVLQPSHFSASSERQRRRQIQGDDENNQNSDIHKGTHNIQQDDDDSSGQVVTGMTAADQEEWRFSDRMEDAVSEKGFIFESADGGKIGEEVYLVPPSKNDNSSSS